MGRDNGHVWPLTILDEMSRSRTVLGTCRSSYGALLLWLNGVGTPGFLCWFPGGTDTGRQGSKPVLLFQVLWPALVAVSSLPALDSNCPQPWWEPWEKNPQKRRNVWMDSALKDICISFWGNETGEGETLTAS